MWMTIFRHFGIKKAEKWSCCWGLVGVKENVFSRRGKCIIVCRQVYGSTLVREIINEDRRDERSHGIFAKAK